jgi:hypothetical protein
LHLNGAVAWFRSLCARRAKAEEAARLEAAKSAKPKIHIKFDD